MTAAHECRTVTIDEAAKILGLSRGAAYQAARTGELPVLRIGHRLLVPRALLDEMLQPRRESESASPK